MNWTLLPLKKATRSPSLIPMSSVLAGGLGMGLRQWSGYETEWSGYETEWSGNETHLGSQLTLMSMCSTVE